MIGPSNDKAGVAGARETSPFESAELGSKDKIFGGCGP